VRPRLAIYALPPFLPLRPLDVEGHPREEGGEWVYFPGSPILIEGGEKVVGRTSMCFPAYIVCSRRFFSPPEASFRG
jgi:hypothetical protein